MKSKSLTVVSMFIASILVGYNMFPSVQPVQAAPPVIPLAIEVPILAKELPEQAETPVIDIEYNLETENISISGTTDAHVNFKTVGKQKPIVKWRTKVKEVPISTGYPHIKAMTKVNSDEKPTLTYANE